MILLLAIAATNHQTTGTLRLQRCILHLTRHFSPRNNQSLLDDYGLSRSQFERAAIKYQKSLDVTIHTATKFRIVISFWHTNA
jgi:hypothetical protein